MAKGFRIVLRWLVISLCALMVPCMVFAQKMPDMLDLDYLLNQPKFRNIHHDSFCRENNSHDIGHNALLNRPGVLGYATMALGDYKVGVQDNCARNFILGKKKGRVIKYLNVSQDDYHVLAVRADDPNCDAKVAFFIRDINNFYYVSLTGTKCEVFRFLNGSLKKVSGGGIGGNRLEIFVTGRKAEIVINGQVLGQVELKEWESNRNLCGLMFDNRSVSKVDDFIVDRTDFFEDAGIDPIVERGEVENPIFGTYCAEVGACTASRFYTNRSKRSYRFELIKPKQKQVERNRNNALHSTVMLDCKKEGGYKPLDSFVFSVDVLFPRVGNEAWILDDIFAENIIQVHHTGYIIPFSPSIAININKGRIYLSTIWLESIAKGTSPFDNDLNYRAEYIGRLNSDAEESYLESKGFGNYSRLQFIKKGEWHNITLFVKLGYNMNQEPRTVLYLDNELVIDWYSPNSYNCQEFGEFVEFGVYKWDWDTEEKRNQTSIKKRVVYFDNIMFFN